MSEQDVQAAKLIQLRKEARESLANAVKAREEAHEAYGRALEHLRDARHKLWVSFFLLVFAVGAGLAVVL